MYPRIYLCNLERHAYQLLILTLSLSKGVFPFTEILSDLTKPLPAETEEETPEAPLPGETAPEAVAPKWLRASTK